MNRRVCMDCLDVFKRSDAGKAAKKAAGKWSKSMWPDWVRHSEPTKKCTKHQAYASFYGSSRRARKLEASPAWADPKAIKAVYLECARVTKATGIKHEVDHMVPLNGKLVRGLHVAENLQILRKTENQKKSNHYSV